MSRPLVLIAAALAATGCRTEVPDEANIVANATVAETPAPAPLPVPVPVAPLDRAELLAAIRAAADARAAGAPLPEANRELVGRSFALALPFGCAGAAEEDAEDWAMWTFDEEREVLKLRAEVPIAEGGTWLRELAPELALDAVEGFWIERPWTNSEACVAAPPRAEGLPPARPTVAIAQFFPPDAPRTRQRSGRPYAATLRASEVPSDRSRGFELAIEGRIAAFGDRQPVHCRIDAADLPPVCVAAVEITHVAFRNPAGGQVLAEWDR